VTATNHVLTGAVIALVARRPELAIPCAFVSHFALDAVPHFGFEEENEVVRNDTKLFKTVILLDAVAVATLLIALPVLAQGSGMTVQLWVIVASMLAAFAPDLVWIYRFFHEMHHGQSKPMGRFTRFHLKVQWSETIRGLHVEYIWGACMILLFGALV
jgi:hypothetical protein